MFNLNNTETLNSESENHDLQNIKKLDSWEKVFEEIKLLFKNGRISILFFYKNSRKELKHTIYLNEKRELGKNPEEYISLLEKTLPRLFKKIKSFFIEAENNALYITIIQ